MTCSLPIERLVAVQTHRAIDRDGKAAGVGDAVDAKLAIKLPRSRNHHLPGGLIDGDHPVDPEKAHQRAAAIGIEAAVDTHDSGARMIRRAVGLAIERDADRSRLRRARAWRPCRRGDARSTISTPWIFAGASRSAMPRNRSPACGAKLPTKPVTPVNASASRSSVKRPRGCDDNVVDASADIERRSTDIADRQTLDAQDAGIELDPRIDGLRVDAGEGRLADIEDERDLVRHLKRAAGVAALAKATKASMSSCCAWSSPSSTAAVAIIHAQV